MTNLVGASSHFSIVSPAGALSLERQTGSQSLRNIAQKSSNKWRLVDWYPQGLQQDTSCGQRYSLPLPPKHLLQELVCEYFQSVNLITPLFEPAAFMKFLDRQFSWNPSGNSSWWAALNTVLAFAYRNRAEKSDNSGDEWCKCLGHIKNAMSVVADLYMRTCDLLAVQAMIGLALFFQGTPNPQPLFMFTAAAIRFSQSMGLHRAGSFGLCELEIEERQRVFWAAFMLDADICLRTGRPAAQDFRDFDVPFPSNCPRDGLGVIESQGEKVNLFAIMAHFAFIQRRVYELLFTTEALKRPMSERVDNARICIEEVDRWKETIPHNLRPQRDFSAESHPFLPHILRLHFACHCCYMNINRVFIFTHEQPPYREDESPSQSVAYNESTQKSLEAARSAIDLISQIETHNFGQSFEWYAIQSQSFRWTWPTGISVHNFLCLLIHRSIVYFPAAAIVALFSQIMLNPHYAEAESDLCLITRTVKFLSKLAAQEQDTYVDYVLSMCCGFEQSAREAIDTTKFHGTEYGKETRPTKDPRAQGNPRLAPLLEGEAVATNDDFGSCHDRIPRPPSAVQDDQNLLTLEPFSLPAHIFWNWQDMLAGVPPAYDFGVEDFHYGSKNSV